MRGCGSAGVGGSIPTPFWATWLDEALSRVSIVSPRLLGRFLGGLGGTINDGEGGAENGRPVVVANGLDSGSRGSCGTWRLDAEVFTERFLVLRIFLFGESARLRFETLAKGFESCSPPSIDVTPAFVDLNDERGDNEIGDSGEELGDGSVMEESNVEIVVVGEDSIDSKVDAESLRSNGKE